MVVAADRRDAIVQEGLAEGFEVVPCLQRRRIDAALFERGNPVVEPAKQLHVAGQVKGLARKVYDAGDQLHFTQRRAREGVLLPARAPFGLAAVVERLNKAPERPHDVEVGVQQVRTGARGQGRLELRRHVRMVDHAKLQVQPGIRL